MDRIEGVIGPVYDAKAKRRVQRLLPEKSEYHVYLVRKVRRPDRRRFDLECPPKAWPEAVESMLDSRRGAERFPGVGSVLSSTRHVWKNLRTRRGAALRLMLLLPTTL